MKKVVYCFALLLLPTMMLSQNIEDGSEGNILYSKETTGAVNVNTFGFGGSFKQCKTIDAFKSRFYEIGFTTYRDSKEVTFPAMYHGYSSFKFGKLNSIAILRGSLGMNYNISRKPVWGGVDIDMVYSAGVSIAIAKPIYMYVVSVESIGIENYYTESLERYNPDIHTDVNILGKAPFYVGLLESIPYFGINCKLGLNFDYAEYDNHVRSIELGGIIDYMPIGVPIMAYNDNKNLFFSFYLSLYFGRRYN